MYDFIFIEILLSIICGILSGIFCGLAPGIHSNLVSTVVIGLSPILLLRFDSIIVAVFIVSMSVAQSFHDCIPSIFLGAPDESQVLGVLPGHRMLLRGKGLLAVKLVVLGCFGASVISVFMFPIFVLIVKYFYPMMEKYIPYLILLAVGYMIARDRNKIWAIVIFAISGIYGVICFSIPNFSDPLFPMLSGLFGISTLLYSLSEENHIPEQKNESDNSDERISFWKYLKALFSGAISGFITAIMPGLGAGMASVISSQITPGLGDDGFLILLGSINSFNFNLSLVAYLVLDKARNGSVIAIQSLLSGLTISNLLLFLSVILIVSAICISTSIYLAGLFTNLISYVDYKKIMLTVVVFIVFLAIILGGWIGIILLITSTAIGFLPAIKKTSRTMAMGCLVVPVMLFFFGLR